MAKLTKRVKNIASKVDSSKMYNVDEAIKLLKECSAVKFNETIELSINLGIDARKSDQNVRGAVVLPNGTGKDVRVAVFVQGELAEEAKSAGADIVGFDELAEDIKAGKIEFDTLIATPDSMRVVGKLGPILGPRGIMPNPKTGTVTKDVVQAIKNAKAGQVNYRNDKAGIVHGAVGKVDFEIEALKNNIKALLVAVKKAKPASSKGIYLKKLTLSSTMGPGLSVDISSLDI